MQEVQIRELRAWKEAQESASKQQKAELKFLQQGINPTPKQLEKAIEDFGKEALK